jgi:hypothetical protein
VSRDHRRFHPVEYDCAFVAQLRRPLAQRFEAPAEVLDGLFCLFLSPDSLTDRQNVTKNAVYGV